MLQTFSRLLETEHAAESLETIGSRIRRRRRLETIINFDQTEIISKVVYFVSMIRPKSFLYRGSIKQKESRNTNQKLPGQPSKEGKAATKALQQKKKTVSPLVLSFRRNR